MAEDCVFCKIVSGEMESDKVYEDDWMVVFRDREPKARTHLLLVPRKHIPRPREVAETDKLLVGHLVHVAGEVAEKEGLSSYRLVANDGPGAGQAIKHLHFHLLGGQELGWPPFPAKS